MSVVLTGLDGSNPLAFFAALGALLVAEERLGAARLSWEDQGRWRPVLHGVDSADALIEAALLDLRSWDEEPALRFAYNGAGVVAPGAPDAAQDLKPPPKAARALFASLVGSRRSAAMAAAWFTEIAVDNKGNIKPTALHFTAGQQAWLSMVVALQQGVGEAELREALVGPWRGESRLPSLSWDATVARVYALRASDPSAEKRGSVPGADWLAARGLALLPVAPMAARAQTACVRGGWKDGEFTWPLWLSPAGSAELRGLLTTAKLDALSSAERAARGIGAIFSAAITRSDQGGYGGFNPARPV